LNPSAAEAALTTISQGAIAASKTWWLGWAPLMLLPALAIWFRGHVPAWLFMWALSFAIFFGLKWLTWWDARDQVPHNSGRSLAYLLAWPGMDAETFLDIRRIAAPLRFRDCGAAFLKTAIGILLLWVIARRIPEHELLLQGWIGLVGLVCLLHFGAFHLVALFWQARGIVAQPIMSEPLRSKTLAEFWGRRWNLGFRQLAHERIFRPLHKRIGVTAAGLLVFLLSGLIHDFVISVPAHGGYGLPTGYFILQGLGVAVERSRFGRHLGLQRGAPAWLFMLVVTAAPAFWLFHPAFVLGVILPFMQVIHAL
jgi:alginate O-acetyltransferase complex protein AlgI